jgi:hypothetical protein
MKQLKSLAAAAVLGIVGQGAAHAATCTPTGFVADAMNLTAAFVNPSEPVTGGLNATGCDIGVYYGAGRTGTVAAADIYGARYFGVINDGANVSVQYSAISNIGESPFNGAQHGIGIYFSAARGTKGSIANSFIWKYQKGGIVVSAQKTTTTISNNTVIGEGPVNYIAQNGIEVYGASANITGNTVSGNAYTGPNGVSSGGVLLVGGAYFGIPSATNNQVSKNTLIGNDVGVFDVNALTATAPVGTPTKNQILSNFAVDNVISNTTGNSPTMGYQAGISVFSNGDSVESNVICGVGYTGASTNAYSLNTIDTSGSVNVQVKSNSVCPSALPQVVGDAVASIPSASSLVGTALRASP